MKNTIRVLLESELECSNEVKTEGETENKVQLSTNKTTDKRLNMERVETNTTYYRMETCGKYRKDEVRGN